jgi:DNA polymerase III delta prime subunit
MPFSDFVGNPETIHRMREMLTRNRFPHAVILSGAKGSGKYTLSLMLARAMNCLEQPMTEAASLNRKNWTPALLKRSRLAKIYATPTRKKPGSSFRLIPTCSSFLPILLN